MGESLGDGDAVGRRFPVGGVVFNPLVYLPRVKTRSSMDVRWWRHRRCSLPKGVAFGLSSCLRCELTVRAWKSELLFVRAWQR